MYLWQQHLVRVKRVELEQFSNVRSNGLRAIELKKEDTLIGVAITDGEQQIMLFSNEGKAIRFSETDARVMGRTAKGVRWYARHFSSSSGPKMMLKPTQIQMMKNLLI